MGKLGDLWVRLGLKSDDYKKGMKEAKKETSSFSQGLGKMKAGAVAVWAAIGTAVAKFATDFIGATNRINDAWSATMSAFKASYQSVLADMANYKPDFSSFREFFKGEWEWIKKTFGNAKEAGDAASEMTKAFDAEFELVNSVRLQKQMMQEELNELYVAMRDTTLSPADRKAAANRYREMLQPLADAEIRIYSNMLEKASEAWQSGSNGMLSRKYSTDEMREFFANYGTNPEAMKAKYGELASVYENRKGDKQNQIIFDILMKLAASESQMSDVTKILSRTELSIDKALAELDSALYNTLAEDLAGGIEDVYDAVDDLEDVEIVMPEIDLSALDKAEKQVEEFVEKWRKEQEEIESLNKGLEDSIVSSLSGGMEAFTDMLFGLEGADAKNILAALLSPFADTATQLGQMLIAQGIAVEAFKKSLESLQGTTAIVAGTALLAIGAAMRSGIRSLAGGGAGSGTSYGGGSYGSTGDALNYDSTLTIYVEGKISGSDILISGKKTQNKWDR
jgi:hypothetical protein